MIPSLAREQFLDRTWGPADLDAVAEFWLKLYAKAAESLVFTATPEHRTEIRLRGFPRADADRLTMQVRSRAPAADFGALKATHLDPDTLSLDTGYRNRLIAPPAGLGLPVVATPEFEGNVVELRFTASDRNDKLLGTLVLTGELRGGAFRLKSAWRAGRSRDDDEVFRFAPWVDESAFLKSFDEFRRSGVIDGKLAKKFFLSRSAEHGGRCGRWLVSLPLEKPRLRGLSLRLAVLAGLTGLWGAALYWAWEIGNGLNVLILAMFAIPLGILLFQFLRTEYTVWSLGYFFARSLFRKLDEEGRKLVPLTQHESAAADSHCLIRKYAAELTAAGFISLGKARFLPASVGEIILVVFAAPDGSSFLAVVFQFTSLLDPGRAFHCWPAKVTLMCQTFLNGGGHVASTSWLRNGFRRKLTGPECLPRVFAGVNDPITFLELHAKAVAGFVAETGNRPLRHGRFEDYLRLQNALAEEERRLYADSPYTLGDHLRWYLQIPRREFRG
jgi:hypothetical protein